MRDFLLVAAACDRCPIDWNCLACGGRAWEFTHCASCHSRDSSRTCRNSRTTATWQVIADKVELVSFADNLAAFRRKRKICVVDGHPARLACQGIANVCEHARFGGTKHWHY